MPDWSEVRRAASSGSFTMSIARPFTANSAQPTVRTLHAAVGAALEVRRERGGEVLPGDVARHYVHAIATVEPDRAIRWADEAAQDDRRRLAFSEAAGHLRRVRLAALDGGRRIESDVMTRLLMDEADNEARSGDPMPPAGCWSKPRGRRPVPRSLPTLRLPCSDSAPSSPYLATRSLLSSKPL